MWITLCIFSRCHRTIAYSCTSFRAAPKQLIQCTNNKQTSPRQAVDRLYGVCDHSFTWKAAHGQSQANKCQAIHKLHDTSQIPPRPLNTKYSTSQIIYLHKHLLRLPIWTAWCWVKSVDCCWRWWSWLKRGTSCSQLGLGLFHGCQWIKH